jgi:hypothetical protein
MCDDFMSGEGWAVIGPMSEDIINEELEIEKARRGTLGENYLVLRPTLFDPSNPEISGFELGKESLPARAKKAGNVTSQIRRI